MPELRALPSSVCLEMPSVSRWEKKAVLFHGNEFVAGNSLMGLFFLQPAQVRLDVCLAVMAGFGVSTAYLIPWSVPDVIE